MSDEKKVPSVELAKIKEQRFVHNFESGISSAGGFQHYWNIAEVFAGSAFVPKHFQGKAGECFIALEMAREMGEHPLMLMQSLYLVGGRPGWMTQYMISRANRLSGWKSRIRWRTESAGDDIQGYPNIRVTAYATDENGEEVAATVDTQMAVSEGWTRNAKYKSMFGHMMSWRAAAFLIRLYCPEVMMGFRCIEELETMPPAEAKEVAAPVSLVVAKAVEKPPAKESPETEGLAPLQVEALKKEADENGVSWDELQGAMGGPIAELVVSDEQPAPADLFRLVSRAIKEMAGD